MYIFYWLSDVTLFLCKCDAYPVKCDAFPVKYVTLSGEPLALRILNYLKLSH